jgi:flagellar hook-associated protein 3 FlgL
MSTRITNNMMSRGMLSDLTSVQNSMSRTHRKLSSGREIERASDDPFRANRALAARNDLEAIAQRQRNVTDAIAWTDVTEIALNRISEAVQRARELVVKGSNGTESATSRDAIASEIEQLIDAVKQEMNANYGGRYVFSGTETTVAPYVQGATDTYFGDGNAVIREIGDSVNVRVNVVGSDLLGQGQAAGDGKLLDVLRDAVQHLRGNTDADIQALRSTDLAGLDTNLENLSKLRATTGAMTNRLETADSRLAELEETATKLLSDAEDADMARTLIDLSMQQSVYQSALKSGANIVQASLLDFLR